MTDIRAELAKVLRKATRDSTVVADRLADAAMLEHLDRTYVDEILALVADDRRRAERARLQHALDVAGPPAPIDPRYGVLTR